MLEHPTTNVAAFFIVGPFVVLLPMKRREMAFAVTLYSFFSLFQRPIRIILFPLSIQFTFFSFDFFSVFSLYVCISVACFFFFIQFLSFCHKIRMIISTLTAPQFSFFKLLYRVAADT